MKTETEIQKEILEYLKNSDLAAGNRTANEGRRVSGAGRVKAGRLGIPDISGHVKSDGRALYVEVKKPGKKLSYDQWIYLTEANLEGCLGCCCRSVDDVVYFLATYKDRMVDNPDYEFEYLDFEADCAKLV